MANGRGRLSAALRRARWAALALSLAASAAGQVARGSNGIFDQFIIQAKAVGVTIVWSGVVSLIAYKIVDLTIGLRVPEDEEREGLDITSHGETAYSN